MDRCFECGSPKTERHFVVPQPLGGTSFVALCTPCHDLAHGLDLPAEVRTALLSCLLESRRTGGVVQADLQSGGAASRRR